MTVGDQIIIIITKSPKATGKSKTKTVGQEDFDRNLEVRREWKNDIVSRNNGFVEFEEQ